MRIVGILLAAGRSERFGGDKLVVPLTHATEDIDAGTPIGVAACRHLIAAVPETVAVVRPGDCALADLLRDAGARVVDCARAGEGLGASLACGVSVTADADGWIVALADMPWTEPTTIAKLVAALERGADIVAPSFGGQRGHPVGFARRHHSALSSLRGDEGARAIIAATRATVELLPTDDGGVVRDIDTRDQL